MFDELGKPSAGIWGEDIKELREAQIGQNKKRKEFEDAVFRTFTTEQGKRVLDELVKEYIFRANTTNDPHILAMFEGQKSIVLEVYNIVERMKNPQKLEEEYE